MAGLFETLGALLETFYKFLATVINIPIKIGDCIISLFSSISVDISNMLIGSFAFVFVMGFVIFVKGGKD